MLPRTPLPRAHRRAYPCCASATRPPQSAPPLRFRHASAAPCTSATPRNFHHLKVPHQTTSHPHPKGILPRQSNRRLPMDPRPPRFATPRPNSTPTQNLPSVPLRTPRTQDAILADLLPGAGLSSHAGKPTTGLGAFPAKRWRCDSRAPRSTERSPHPETP